MIMRHSRKQFAQKLVMTEHGMRRVRERVMSQDKFKTSDEYLLATMALKKGHKPPRSFHRDFAVRPNGFSRFCYRFYSGMIYCFGLVRDEAHLLTVYYADHQTYRKIEEQKQGQSTPVSITTFGGKVAASG